ncbi:Protein kri1 [Termitomyces sp. T112]|nr:Protein kri1 [Termitomyces sp. T112]
MLSDSDSEGSDGQSFHQITINEHYAKAFEYRKEREELQKLKDKYGSDIDDSEVSESDSESDETEDEDGDELTPTVDAAILRTLVRIKRKDPSIYDSTTNIYGEEHEKVVPVSKHRTKPRDKSRPVTIRQMALQTALEPDERSPSPEPHTHVEEQRALRDETIAAFHDAVKDQDEDFLVLREKTQDEEALEEEEYRAFLEREVGGDLRKLVDVQPEEHPLLSTVEGGTVKDADKGKEKKKRQKAKEGKASKEPFSAKSKQESDHEFLMNYILNRGWIDRSTKHIPTYGEIISTNSKKKNKDGEDTEFAFHDEENDSEDFPTEDPDLDEDDFEEIVDRFESSYNFRFEEPDAGIIPTYPRNLPSLARREDTTRKEARERRKQRKAEELQKKKEEVKRLKGLKMKEIRARLERIGREGGKSVEHNKALQGLDLDADWDSAAHDRQMAELYHDDDDVDNEKPQWDEDIDIGDIPVDDAEPTKQKKKKKKKAKGEDDEVGVDVDDMDADVKGNDNKEWDGTEEMRKRVLNEYMDEIHGLDFNDLVGDLSTRFKYTPVQPDSFALTPVEILMATDQELNEYMGIKKFAPYRQAMKWDSKRNERLKELKSKITKRTGKSDFERSGHVDEGNGDRLVKKRKGKKERMRVKAAGADEGKKQPTPVSPPPTKHRRDTDEANDGEENKQAEGKKRRRKDKVEVS